MNMKHAYCIEKGESENESKKAERLRMRESKDQLLLRKESL
jgi:hypothetical protein